MTDIYAASPDRDDIYEIEGGFSVTPHVLFSYAYHRQWAEDGRMAVSAREGCKLILDSGAFSAFRGRVDPISLEDHTAFVEQHGHRFEFCAALDVIGNPYKTLENYEWQRTRVPVVPTFHCGAPLTVLAAYLDSGTTRLALGGLANGAIHQNVKHQFCTQAFNVICDEDGVPRLPVHGFGMVSGRLLVDFPWSTTDGALGAYMAARRSVSVRRGADIDNVYFRGEDVQTETGRSINMAGPEGAVLLERCARHGYQWPDVVEFSSYQMAFSIREMRDGASLVTERFKRHPNAIGSLLF